MGNLTWRKVCVGKYREKGLHVHVEARDMMKCHFGRAVSRHQALSGKTGQSLTHLSLIWSVIWLFDWMQSDCEAIRQSPAAALVKHKRTPHFTGPYKTSHSDYITSGLH